MKLVIDANILFTFFWPGSALRQMLNKEAKLYSPAFAIQEINEHKKGIIRRTRNTTTSFQKLVEEIKLQIELVHLQAYATCFDQVCAFIKHFPTQEQDKFLKDADYLALALYLKCPLWTNDFFLKKQKFVRIITTRDVLECL